MISLTIQPKTILRALAAMLLFATIAAAQITGLCNTGQTRATDSGCTGILVTLNPEGGGPNRDGNWALLNPYPSTLSAGRSPCSLTTWVAAWVDTPNAAWLANGASTPSEWITPYNGENNIPAGWYVYVTRFPVPSVLPGGGVPTSVTINGRLASDNPTYGMYMSTGADGGSCSLVAGLPQPINPAGVGFSDFQQWLDFSFTNPIPITPGSDLFLGVVVVNVYDTSLPAGDSPTSLRVEFFPTSAFN